MCTMTWFDTDNGYQLFFNRDEMISRRRALLPSIQSDGNVRYISPTDTDAGGTWITVNHFGVTVCLLNHYQFEQIESYKEWISRGEIVRQFAASHDIEFAAQRFMRLELEDYRAFRMFLIDKQGNNYLCVWDGHKPRLQQQVDSPKSSSSIDAKHVKASRKQRFDELALDTSKNNDAYLAYHSEHWPDRSRESVCMHRDQANTVSLCHIIVADDEIKFSYADGAPCTAELAAALHLPLKTEQRADTKPVHIAAIQSAAMTDG